MSQRSSSSSRTISSALTDNPQPGDDAFSQPGDDATLEDIQSDNDDNSSSFTTEQTEHVSSSTVANALVIALQNIDFLSYINPDNGQYSFLPSPPDQQPAPDKTGNKIEYVHGFPGWQTFALCDSVVEDVDFRVLIHPVFDCRFAVPMLQMNKPACMTTKPPMVLWDIYELRYYIHWDHETLLRRVRLCLKMWRLVMQVFVNRITEAFNDMLGTWVLWRSITRCMCGYRCLISDCRLSKYGDVEDEYRSVCELLTSLGTSLDAKIRLQNTPSSALWKKALDAVGY